MSLGAGGSTPRPTIGQAVSQAWRDTFAALRALAGPAQIAFFLCMVVSVARYLFQLVQQGGATASLLGEFVLSIAQAFLLTPFLIAVHRFIILGEAGRYRLAPGEHRFKLFFLWSIVLSLFAWFPPFLLAAIKIAPARGPALLFAFVVVIYALVAIVVMLRLIILFPAIAVDAPGATWRNSMADTKGHAWRILFIGLLASLPLFGVVFLLVMAGVPVDVSTASTRSSIGRVAIATVVDAAFSVVGLTIAVAIASRLYEQLAKLLHQPV